MVAAPSTPFGCPRHAYDTVNDTAYDTVNDTPYDTAKPFVYRGLRGVNDTANGTEYDTEYDTEYGTPYKEK